MKKKMSLHLLILVLSVLSVSAFAQKKFTLKAPKGDLEVNVTVGSTIEYTVSHAGDLMLDKSPLSMTLMPLSDGSSSSTSSFGIDAKLLSSSIKTVKEQIQAPIYKRNTIEDNYTELTLNFKGAYTILFRAYNDGVAYRFVSNMKQPFYVEKEQVVFNFPSNQKAFVPYVRDEASTLERQFYNSFENKYEYINIANWNAKRLAFLPLVVEGVKGKKTAIAEADLLSYPGMYLHNGNASTNLQGVFAPYPKEIRQGGHNMLQGEVQSHENYLAKCEGATRFPWRILIVSESDQQLADNDMVYKLATPSQITDFSWIKPGKVAWDWWNDWNLSGVDFRAGINNDTYKYYIDFASEYGIEYVILDEGWAVNMQSDLMQVIPEIDLKELVAYAKKRNVDLILWAGYYAMNKDIEGICKHYADMGIKGFKIDFMDRDDQLMVEFHHRTAQIAAKYHLLVDFHGTYKPTGLQRTYPNVINFEGVNGLEQMKWMPSNHDQVTYDVTIPFVRMIAGPLDYTQGAMRNAKQSNYFPVNSEAMSQGTRCHQLAEYVVFESPLNMLCDSPSNYMKEKESTTFIANIPTTWDNTVSLNGEIAKYISIARQKGNEWYVGAMNNWDARNLTLNLSFLGEGSFEAEVFKDGINADRAAHDYKKEIITIPNNKQLPITMAPGGGYVMRIYKK